MGLVGCQSRLVPPARTAYNSSNAHGYLGVGSEPSRTGSESVGKHGSYPIAMIDEQA